MNESVKRFLETMVSAYNELSMADEKLAWDILTALPGPGERPESERIKCATSGIIRWVVFGKSYVGTAVVTREDTFEHVFVRQHLKDADHFVYHAKEAFKALGLKWDEINDLNKEARDGKDERGTQ